MSDTAIQFNLPTLIVGGDPPDPSLLIYVKLEVSGTEDFAEVLLTADTEVSVSLWWVADDDDDGEMVAWPFGGLPTLHLGCAAHYRIGTSLAAGDYYVRVSLRDAETADVVNWDTGFPYKTWAWTCTAEEPPAPPPVPPMVNAPHIFLENTGDGVSMHVQVLGDAGATHYIFYSTVADGPWATYGLVSDGTYTIDGLTPNALYYVCAVSLLNGIMSAICAVQTLQLVGASTVGLAHYEHWVFDLTTGGFFPMGLTAGHVPTALLSHHSSSPALADVVLGGFDGIIRRYMRQQKTDDGLAFTSYCVIGPIQLGRPGHKGVVDSVRTVFAEMSDEASLSIAVADTPEQTVSTGYDFVAICQAGDNLERPRLRGGAFVVRIASVGDVQSWTYDSGIFERHEAGKDRTHA